MKSKNWQIFKTIICFSKYNFSTKPQVYKQAKKCVDIFKQLKLYGVIRKIKYLETKEFFVVHEVLKG